MSDAPKQSGHRKHTTTRDGERIVGRWVEANVDEHRRIAPPHPSTLSINIWRLRGIRGFSKSDLAYRSGLSRPALHNIECEGATPHKATLLRLAAALDVSVETLLAEPRPLHEAEWSAEGLRLRDTTLAGEPIHIATFYGAEPEHAQFASAAPDMARVIPKLLTLLQGHDLCTECRHYGGEHGAQCQARATVAAAYAALRKAGVR